MWENGVTVTCRRPISGFSVDHYREEDHAFSNSIILPSHVFDRLGMEPFGYVEARREGADEPPTHLYALPFAAAEEPSEDVAALGTNMMLAVGPEIGRGSTIELRPADPPTSRPLAVTRTYSLEGTEYGQYEPKCFVPPDVRRSLGLSPGDAAEVYCPESGARVRPRVFDLLSDDRDGDKARIDLHLAEALGVGFGDDVRIRRIPGAVPDGDGLTTRVLERLVGSRPTTLRVKRGKDQDEGRNIVRLDESTMDYLGVSPGEKVVLRWDREPRTAQCLLPPDGEDVSPHEVLVPNSERDVLGLNPNDGVLLTRSVSYVFYNRIAVSILGILGVVFGVFQISNAIDLLDMLSPVLDRTSTVLLLLLLSLGLSAGVVWLLLLPERHRCK